MDIATSPPNVRFIPESGHGSGPTPAPYLSRPILFCFLVLSQMHEPHATQHIGRLGELNVVITDDLYSVAPGIPTASLSSTTRPKWRPSPAGCLRPFWRAIN